MTRTHDISRRARQALVVFGAGVLIAPAAAQASAPAVKIERATKAAKAGQKAQVTVRTANVESCKLTVGKAAKTVQMQGGTKVRFAFTVARKAKPGSYKLAVTCDTVKASTKLKVKKATKSRALRAATTAVVKGRITAQVSGRPAQQSDDDEIITDGRPVSDQPAGVTPKAPVAPNSPEVTAYWEQVKPSYANDTSGECTQWAFSKRLDIVERVARSDRAAWLNSGAPVYVARNWTAWRWADNARSVGMQVDQIPAAGAIAVTPATAAIPSGHVAYVEEVAADGSFRVTDMGYDGEPTKVGNYWIAADQIGAQGLQFIH